MAKISIGKTNAPRSMKDQILDAGVDFTRLEDGTPVLVVKFPGVDSLAFTRDSLGMVVDTLDRSMPEGSDPGSVFARSATQENDGSLSDKFSDAKRSRSINFTSQDRTDVASLLDEWGSKWGDFEAALSEAEAEANADQSSGE